MAGGRLHGAPGRTRGRRSAHNGNLVGEGHHAVKGVNGALGGLGLDDGGHGLGVVVGLFVAAAVRAERVAADENEIARLAAVVLATVERRGAALRGAAFLAAGAPVRPRGARRGVQKRLDDAQSHRTVSVAHRAKPKVVHEIRVARDPKWPSTCSAAGADPPAGPPAATSRRREGS